MRGITSDSQILRRAITYPFLTLQWSHKSAMASEITGISIVYSTVCSGADQRKRQSSASLAFVRGTHRNIYANFICVNKNCVTDVFHYMRIIADSFCNEIIISNLVSMGNRSQRPNIYKINLQNYCYINQMEIKSLLVYLHSGWHFWRISKVITVVLLQLLSFQTHYQTPPSSVNSIPQLLDFHLNGGRKVIQRAHTRASIF